MLTLQKINLQNHRFPKLLGLILLIICTLIGQGECIACGVPKFPILVGGIDGDTYFSQIDYSSTIEKFAALFTSQHDTGGLGCGVGCLQPLIVQYQVSTEIKEYIKNLNYPHSWGIGIQYSTDASRIIVHTGGHPAHCIIILAQVDGSVLLTKLYKSYATLPQFGFDGTYQKVMLLGQGATPAYYIGTHNFHAWQNADQGNYMLLKGYIDSSTTPTWTTISSTQGRIKSLSFAESENFIYAYCIEGPSFDQHFIHRIQVCDGCATLPRFFVWTFGFNKIISGYPQLVFEFSTFGSSSSIFFGIGSEGSSAKTFGNMILDSSGAIQTTKLLEDSATTIIQQSDIKGVKSVTVDIFRLVFYNTVNSATILGTLVMSTRVLKMMQVVQVTLSPISTAMFIKPALNDDFVFMSFTTDKFYTINPSFVEVSTNGKKQALIHRHNQDHNCQIIIQDPYDPISALLTEVANLADYTGQNIPYLIVNPAVSLILGTMSTSGVLPPEGSPPSGTSTTLATSSLKTMPGTCTQVPYQFEMPAVRNEVIIVGPVIEGEAKTLSYPDIIANKICASTAATFQLTMVPIIPGLSVLSVNSIKVESSIVSGTYEFKIIALIEPLYQQMTQRKFSLTVRANTAPYFQTSLIDQTVALGVSKDYTIPNIIDNEGDTSLSVYISLVTPFQDFISTSFTSTPRKINMNPSLNDFPSLGDYIFDLSISDGYKSQIKSFKVTVTNSAPIFSTTPPDVTVAQGGNTVYTLPSYSDPEGHSVTVTVTGYPSFSTYDPVNKQLTITPSATEALGSTTVTVTLSDSNMVTTYTFKITVSAVVNTVPYFQGTISDFHVEMFATVVVNIPTTKDNENDATTVIVKKSDGSALPSFITYTETQITVATTSTSTTTTVGMWVKDASLTSAMSTFSVIIDNTQDPVCSSPPSASTTTISVHIKSTDNSLVMSCSDPPMNGPLTFQYYVQGTTTIPSYISIPKSTFIIAPALASEIGTQIIEGKACDAGNLCSALFSFKVTVINDYPVFGSLPPMADLTFPVITYELFIVPEPMTDTEGHQITIFIVQSNNLLQPAWLAAYPSTSVWNEFEIDTNLAGDLSIPMVIYLCDELNSCGPKYPFTINIGVTAASFSCIPNLISTSIVYAPLSLTTNYDFKCTCSDNSAVTLNLYYLSSPTPLPSWIHYDTTAFKFVITPNSGSLLGTRTIAYQACNPSNVCDTTKTFVLSVTNFRPLFDPAISSLPNQVYTLGQSGQQFKITDPFSDFENHQITLKLRLAGQTTYPSFLMSTADQTTYNIDMANAALGTYYMEVQLCDEFNSCDAVYPFTITFILDWVCDPIPSTATIKTVHLSSSDSFILSCVSSDSSTIYLKTTQQGLTVLPSSVTVNTLAYDISPVLASDVGTFVIEFFLCNSPTFTYCSLTGYLWTLKIVNDPPIFEVTTPFFDNRIINHYVSTVIDLNAPTSDFENHTVTISLIEITSNTLPGFITQISSTNSYTVFAQLSTDVKVHQMQAKVQDQFGAFSTVSFLITIQNLLPLFDASVPTIWKATLGDSITYNAYDPENLAFSLSIINPTTLHFLTILPTSVILNPTLKSQLGTYNIGISLTDGFGTNNIPSQQIIITNSLPYFKTQIPNFVVSLGQTAELKFPIVYDSDPLHQVFCYLTMQNSSFISMPSFIIGYFMSSYTPGIGRICSIKVKPDSATFLGTHLWQIKLSDSYETVTFNFELTVIKNELPQWFIPKLSYLKNIGPPKFGDQETTSYLSIISENQQVYKLPSISDPDQDEYKLTVELGEAIAFADYKHDHQYNTLSFSFSPKTADAKSDYYLIKLTLVDINIYPKSQVYQLYLNVLNSTSFGNRLNASSNNQSISSLKKRIITDQLRIATDLSARIRKITYSGLVTIRFIEPLIIPQNFTLFNNEILELKVIPGVIDAEEYLKRLEQDEIESWIVTKFESQEMEIQVTFVNPSDISSSVIMEDSLQVKFLSNGHFFRSIDKKAIRLNYTIQSNICKQIVYSDSIKRVEKIAYVLAQSLIYMFSGNLVLQFFLSQIMHKMWSLMNTLQLMSFSLKFALTNVPDNLYVFFETITDFRELKASFKQKAQQYLQEKVFKISDSFDQKIQKTLYGMENNTDNDGSFIIDNLGIIVIAAIAIIGLIIFGSVIYVLNKKFEAVRKLLAKVQDKIFWNVGLRFLVQSYFKLILIGLNALLIVDFTTKSKSINTVTGLLHALFAFLFPVSVHIFLTKSSLRISSDESFSSKCRSLFLKLDESNPTALMYTPIFLYRRLIFGILIVFMNFIPGLQIQIAGVISFATLSFILKVRPMAEPMLNFMESFNEVMLILFVTYLPALTNYQPEPSFEQNESSRLGLRILANSSSSLSEAMKQVQIKPKAKRQTQLMNPDEKERNDNVGWILLGIVGIYLTVNILSLVGSVGLEVIKKIKKVCAKKQKEKNKKEDIKNDLEIQQDKCVIPINEAGPAGQQYKSHNKNNSQLSENKYSHTITRSPLILQDVSVDQDHQRDRKDQMMENHTIIPPITEIAREATKKKKRRRAKKKMNLPPVMNDNEIEYLNMGVFNPSYQGKKETVPTAKSIEKKNEEVYQIRQIVYEEEEKKTKHKKKKSKQLLIVPQEQPAVNMRNLQIKFKQHD